MEDTAALRTAYEALAEILFLLYNSERPVFNRDSNDIPGAREPRGWVSTPLVQDTRGGDRFTKTN